jgi:exonuclease III
LADIRLSNRNLVSCSEELKKLFLNNPYEKYNFFFNSTKNKRGIGILLKNNKNFNVLEQLNSEDENLMLLRISHQGSEVILISIYGPNSIDPEFFVKLNDWLVTYRNVPVVIAGDWNATYSSDAIDSNIDVISMQRLPNVNHSNRIGELCTEFNLSDPFRYLYPDKIDFTYIPRNVLNLNKSRLDFFLVSDDIIDFISDCEIKPNLQNKLFDHKAVTITVNKNKKKRYENDK